MYRLNEIVSDYQDSFNIIHQGNCSHCGGSIYISVAMSQLSRDFNRFYSICRLSPSWAAPVCARNVKSSLFALRSFEDISFTQLRAQPHFPMQCHLVVTSVNLTILPVSLNAKLDSKHANTGKFGTGNRLLFNRPLRANTLTYKTFLPVRSPSAKY